MVWGLPIHKTLCHTAVLGYLLGIKHQVKMQELAHFSNTFTYNQNIERVP